MATSVILRTISSVDDKRAGLENSQIARTLSIGNNWNSIRVGIRISALDPGGTISGTPRLALGMCSGTTNLFGDATTTNFVGFVTNVATWAWADFSGIKETSLGMYKATRVGSTLTLAGGDSGAWQFLYGAASGRRTALIAEIVKGSPNYTFRVFGKSGTGDSDMLRADFLNIMGAPAAGCSFSGYAYGGDSTQAASEAAGNLDTVNISWNRNTPIIEVSDVAVARLS